MYSIDLLPVILATVFLLLYNPIMTAVFIGQRYQTQVTIGGLPKKTFQIYIFLAVLIGQFAFTFFADPGVWWFVYFITITILYVWDRIVKRRNMNIRK